MFGGGKLKELEAQLSSMKEKFEQSVKEKTDLVKQLENARSKIQELNQQLEEAREQIQEKEKQLAESNSAELQEQARRTIVEYEGLKELYTRKNREIDEVREKTEEGFAVEAAQKRDDLAQEIKTSQEENQTRIRDTVSTFAGSYQYYLDQVRGLMDAISQAARETGESLFAGETDNIKERFGVKIMEHLQDNTQSLKLDTGDLLLIGTEEAAEAAAAMAGENAEGAAEPAGEEEPEAEAETGEEIQDEPETLEESAEEPAEAAASEGEEAPDTNTAAEPDAEAGEGTEQD